MVIPADSINWLLHSSGGLALRIGLGIGIFASLAWVDWRRRGAQATRWREYVVLLACVAGAMVYGVINDQITCAISWEYFYYGKELAEALGPRTPPDWWGLHLAAGVIGMKATWSAGLIIGVGLVVANNPSKSRPRLPAAELVRQLPVIFIVTALVAAAAGWAGYLGAWTNLSDDFREMVRSELWRPERFMAVWGIHLGGYAGGLVGLVIAMVRIWRRRGKLER